MSALVAVALAATSLSLDQVRTLSRDQNSAALLAELASANAAQQLRSARSVIYPQLQVALSANGTFAGPQSYYSSAIPSVGPNGAIAYAPGIVSVPSSSAAVYSAGLTLTQLLYDGGKWWNAIAQAGDQEQAAARQLAEQRNTSEYEGVRRFYELLRAQKTLATLEAAVQRSREQLARAQALYEAGRTPKSDVYAAQVNLGNDQISLVRQVGTAASAQADLAVWLGQPGAEELVAQEPPSWGAAGEAIPGAAEAVAQARSHRPLLLALAEQEHAAQRGVTVAHAGFLPQLSVSGTVGRTGPSLDPVFTDLRKQNYAQAGLWLQWNLFNGFATDAAQEQARIAQVQAQVNLAQASRDVEADVRRSLAALNADVKAAALAVSNRESAAAGLALAEERYHAGAGSQLEVQDAQLKLTQAELAGVSTRIDVAIAQANLGRALGAQWGATP